MIKYGKKRRWMVPENEGKDVKYTADHMEKAFARDGENVKNAAFVLPIGLKKENPPC
jgi:hypothetical protein